LWVFDHTPVGETNFNRHGEFLASV
jgi:hypothetical protein